MPELRKLGNEIRSIRGALTQQEFAGILEISQGSVAKYENGLTMPRASILVQIADLGHIPVETLLLKAKLDRPFLNSGLPLLSSKISIDEVVGQTGDVTVSLKKISDFDNKLGVLVASLLKAFVKSAKNPKFRKKCREAAKNAIKAVELHT